MGAAAAAQVDVSNYRHYLDDELYTHYGDNRGFGPEHDLARNNIAAIFNSFGLRVRLEAFEFLGTTYYNVVATKVGTLDPTVEYIVGTHYDSFENPGAVDEASGVAVLLESARILSKYDSDYTIRFIAFDREEQGFRGSYGYLQGHLNDDIRGVIVLAHVVWNYNNYNIIGVADWESESFKSRLGSVVETYADHATLVFGTGGDCLSDHIPFGQAGFPACCLCTAYSDQFVQYHTPMDSVDTPGLVDYDHGATFTRVIVGFLVDHAGVTVREPVPAVSGWGLIVMALLVLAAGTVVFARRGAGHSLSRSSGGRESFPQSALGCETFVNREYRLKGSKKPMSSQRFLMVAASAFAIGVTAPVANGQFDNPSRWSAYDPGDHGVGVDPDGYDGIAFDGRYVYFSPGFDGKENHGEVLRYDTEGGFDHAPSWKAYDPGAHGVGLIARGYTGLAFDGRYIYFAPFAITITTLHGEVLRCDTTGEFTHVSSWAAYNPSSQGIGYNATGYADAVFDGRYVYFVPLVNSTGSHGEVLRYDTSTAFDEPLSWDAYDPGANGVGITPDGYKSGVFDGRYVYFAPSHTNDGYHGEVLRYDPQSEFDSPDSWDAYDYGTECGADCNDPGGFATAIFDGRYIYFGPGFTATGSGEALRYDTTAGFFTPSSWVTFDPQSQGLGTWSHSFSGIVFDGRYIYFMPHTDLDIFTEVVLRYDTSASFIDPLSWSVFDPASAGVGTGIDGHHTGVFDGRYVYFAPTNWNYPELVHGEVLRYDTGVPENIPTVSEWGLIVMTLLVLTVGSVLLVRTRRCRIPV
jgi:hypothetical protein